MQQHSGQHLLSAILLRDFSAKTVSFHLGDATSTIDLEGAALDDAQLAAAAQTANALIAAALPFSIRYVTQEQAEAMLAEGLLRKLPPRSGRIRIIEIDGIDTNACGGTHVAGTALIGPLLLRGTERVRGTVRLSFVCGDRALRAAGEDFQLLKTLGQTLSTGVDNLASSIERLQGDNKAATRERAALLSSIALLEAQALAMQHGELVMTTLDPQLQSRDAAYAKLLASALVTSTAVQIALIGVVEPERTSVVLAAKPGVVDCGTLLRTALTGLDGRGGGSKELAQGAMPRDRFGDLATQVRQSILPAV
jgi:alanyl-tRNA synthetase